MFSAPDVASDICPKASPDFLRLVEVPVSTVVRGVLGDSLWRVPHTHSDKELTELGFEREGLFVYHKRSACVDAVVVKAATHSVTQPVIQPATKPATQPATHSSDDLFVCKQMKDILITTVVHRSKRYIDKIEHDRVPVDVRKKLPDGSDVRVLRFFQ